MTLSHPDPRGEERPRLGPREDCGGGGDNRPHCVLPCRPGFVQLPPFWRVGSAHRANNAPANINGADKAPPRSLRLTEQQLTGANPVMEARCHVTGP